MSENKVNEPAGDYGMTYTYADYLKFDFEYMVELIRGKIFRMSPAPKIVHQNISMNLSRILSFFFLNRNCKIFSAPIDVVLPIFNEKKDTSTTVVQPDLCVICNLTKIEEACINGAPDLIIEILSPHTRKKDLQFKYDIYEETGVKEYWIVMPEEKLVEVFVLKKNKYHRVYTYTETDTMQSVIFPDLIVDLKEVFEDYLKN